MTHKERLAYARKWRKKHPHYTRDKMREYRAGQVGPGHGMKGSKLILGIRVQP